MTRPQLEASDIHLANALEVWLTGACTTIAERLSELVHLVGMPRWEALPSGGFKRYPYFATYRHPILETAIFTENPNWNAVEQASSAHENMKRHYSAFISRSDGSGSSFSLQELCLTLIPIPFLISENTVQIKNDINIKNQIFDFINELNSAFITATTIWPIWGIATDELVILDEFTELRELNEEEKKHVLNFGIVDIKYQDIITKQQSCWYGLCKKSYYKKIFDRTDETVFDYQGHLIEIEQTIEDFLVCAPLVKGRIVYHAGGVYSAPNFELGGRLQRGVSGRGTVSGGIRFLFNDNDQTLNSLETEKLCEIWSIIRGANIGSFKKRVTNAARRLYYAETRIKKEDELIDIMIAAESIYLSTDSNELSYRIALNAALWADTNGAERKKIFSEFRKAYGIRSKLVHGSTASIGRIEEAILFIKPVLTHAVRKALGQLGQSASAPDWENMIFENKEIDPLIDAQ